MFSDEEHSTSTNAAGTRSVTDEYLARNAEYAKGFSGPLPLPPAKHTAVVACMDARLDVYRILGLHEEGRAQPFGLAAAVALIGAVGVACDGVLAFGNVSAPFDAAMMSAIVVRFALRNVVAATAVDVIRAITPVVEQSADDPGGSGNDRGRRGRVGACRRGYAGEDACQDEPAERR